LHHQVNKSIEEISSIMRTSSGLWVILNAKSTAFRKFKTLYNAIVE
jgi:hypothetical protein